MTAFLSHRSQNALEENIANLEKAKKEKKNKILKCFYWVTSKIFRRSNNNNNNNNKNNKNNNNNNNNKSSSSCNRNIS